MSDSSEWQGFTTEEEDRVIDALSAKLPVEGFTCGVCGKIDWRFNPGFVLHPVLGAKDEPSIEAASRVFPTVTLFCGNCGNSLFFSVAALGLLDLFDGRDRR